MRQSRKEETAEARFLGSISSSSIRNLLPGSISSKHKSSSNPKIPKSDAENTPPADPNIQVHDDPSLPTTTKQLPSKTSSSQNEVIKSDDAPQDPSVKVVVRIRPVNNDGKDSREEDRTIKKVSSDKLCFGNRQFTFDLVFGSNSNQEDIFQSVGIPLVKNALAGYNTSLLSYGQSGSGKTYTMWGPPSAMVEEHSCSNHMGLAPRIFRMLFSELEREQQGKQFNYQCHCSFLEIYNEKIGDLLDSVQPNLELKEDSDNALYVENLTEEFVTSYEEVTQILIKGLSNRKVGAASLNSRSSRSHIIFTFVIESWCKGTSSKGFSSSKTSKITLIDLAGLNKSKVEDAGRISARESRNVKKSLSQLGRLVDALARETQSVKADDIPNSSSCLTRLLQESLGGNAKLSVICSISPDNKSNGGTLQTLRFGQRVRSIRNKPVINEITEDGVNSLSDQIRQLKEELIREKANVHRSTGSKNGYFKGHNVRESLNQLRVSLNHSLLLPHIDNDTEEELTVDEDDIRQLHKQINELYSSCEGGSSKDIHVSEDCTQFYSVEESHEADMFSGDEIEKEEGYSEKTLSKLCHEDEMASTDNHLCTANTSRVNRSTFRNSISVSSCCEPPSIDEPLMSESPKIRNAQRKSMAVSSSYFGSWNNVAESSCYGKDTLRQSLIHGEPMQSSLKSSKVLPGPTESLAASLQRGLQIIDYHQRNSALNKSSASFSFEHLAPCPEIDKVDCSVKTTQERPFSEDVPATFLCASCGKKISHQASTEVHDNFNSNIDVVEKAQNPDRLKDKDSNHLENEMEEVMEREKELEIVCKEQRAQIEQPSQLHLENEMEKVMEREKELKIVCKEQRDQIEQLSQLHLENEMAKVMEREKDLEIVCKEQRAQIEQLSQLVEKYKGEKETNSIIVYGQEINGEMKHEEYNSLKDDDKISEGNCEIKDSSFDATEKEALLKEIQNLRSKLQLCSDAPVKKSTDKLRSSLISRSIQLRKSGALVHDNGGEDLEKERQRWTEMESEWICLTDELRVDLESNRQRAERVEMELKLEKKCTEELDDALKRAVLGHARMVEHYADLQDRYNDIVAKNNAVMEGIAEVKKAAAKAGKKGHAKFAKALAAELSTMRVEREREREFLKKENRNLKIQLRDTAEAVHAAGELLVRLREAEHALSVGQENFAKVQEENEKLKKKMEKLKRKHKMEMITMKQYLAESKLPESALQPLYRKDSDDVVQSSAVRYIDDDDQAWKAEFGAIYQEHY